MLPETVPAALAPWVASPPDLSPYAAGGSDLPFLVSRVAPVPGPHVVISALTHGNELCGAVALATLLARDIRPTRGRLSLVFVNVEAYRSFNTADPFAARYLDEDMNRVWSDAVLDRPARSREHARAQALRPLIASADYLLDLHSTSMASAPMVLCGPTSKGRALARRLALPAEIVADAGHLAGPRLSDYGAFANEAAAPTGLLLECGQHFEPASAEIALAATLRFLLMLRVIDQVPVGLATPEPIQATRVLDVTERITVRTPSFAFVRSFGSLETIPKAGTLLAHDAGEAIATPYDDCVLIMPARSIVPGETALRLARSVPVVPERAVRR